MRRRDGFHVHESPAQRPQVELPADLFELIELRVDRVLGDRRELRRRAGLRSGQGKAAPVVPCLLRRDRLRARGQDVATAAAGEALAIVGVVHPLVAVVIAELRDFGDLLVEHACAASAGGDRTEAEEAHARRAFTLELAIEVFPQALAARGRQSDHREVLEHRLLVVGNHVRR